MYSFSGFAGANHNIGAIWKNFACIFGLPQKAIDDLILVFLHTHGGQYSKSNGTIFQTTHRLTARQCYI